MARTPLGATPIEPDDAGPSARTFAVVLTLLLWQTGALIIQLLAMGMARQDASENANGAAGVLS